MSDTLADLCYWRVTIAVAGAVADGKIVGSLQRHRPIRVTRLAIRALLLWMPPKAADRATRTRTQQHSHSTSATEPETLDEPRSDHDCGKDCRFPRPPGPCRAALRPGSDREAACARQEHRPRAHRPAAGRRLLRRVRRPGRAPLHRLRHGEEEAAGRRPRLRLRHRGRPPGGRLQPGLLRLRRLAEPGQRREDRQGPGIRAAQRLPGGRHPRRRRRPHPGGRRLAGHVRGHLPQQRPRLRRRPADLPHHGPLRRRRGLLPRPDRLRGHGGQDLAHVHHRPGRDQDRHRRGRGHGDPRRRPPAQRHHRHLHLPGLRRGRRHRVRPRTAGLPALQQPRRGPGAGAPAGAGARRRRPRPGRADPGLGQPALRHAQGHRADRRRRALPGDAVPLRPERDHRLRPGRGPHGGHRGQPAHAVRRHPGHRRLGEGRPLRPALRRLQHPHHHAGGRARASCRARTRSSRASSAAAPSCSTPTPRPPCRS